MFCSHMNRATSRRDFFSRFGLGLGGAALSHRTAAATAVRADLPVPGASAKTRA